MSAVPPADVLVRCDVGPSLGVGHLMRCIALAEELISRGRRVLFCADVAGVPFARRQLESRGIAHVAPVLTPEDHARLVQEVRPSLVVVDSYLLPPAVYDALHGTGVPLLALVDGDLGGRRADIYLDQNIGAELDRPALPPGAVRLAGLRYALIRDDVLARRPASPPHGPRGDPVRVFAVFGGTDPFGAAPVVVEMAARTGLPFDATVVAGTTQQDQRLRTVRLEPGQRLRVVPPTERLAEEVGAADVVLSAAGTSTWELACLGAAAALVCVADNQLESYHRTVGMGSSVGLGLLEDLRAGRPEAVAAAVAAITGLLLDEERRDALRGTAWRLVDGRGRARVADVALRRSRRVRLI